MDLCWQMPLLSNMLSRLVIDFLPRSKRLLISWLQSPSAVILEPPKIKFCHCFHCFPIYLPWSDGTSIMILVFWMLSFKPTFSLSSFTFIKRLFSSSLSAIRVMVSAYLRLLIFLSAILQLFWCLFLLSFFTHWRQPGTYMCLQAHLILLPKLWVMDWDCKVCMVSADTSSVISWHRISVGKAFMSLNLSKWINSTVKKKKKPPREENK